MATDVTTIEISPDSELWQKLQHAAELGQRVRFDAGDIVLEYGVPVVTASAPAGDDDPETERVGGIEEAAGGWVGLIDFDEFLTDLYERRRMVGRPTANLDPASDPDQ